MVEHYRKYTVGHGVGHGSHPGYRPWSCGDRAGVLPAPAGGVVVAVGCTVLQMWCGGVPWALQVRVLHAPAVAGHAAVPDLPGRSAGVRTRRSGRHVEVPDPSRGREVRDSGCECWASLFGWHVATPDPFPSRGRSEAIRVIRWSPDSRSWQNSNGSRAKPISSHVAGPTVLPQHSGWRSSY